MVFLCVLILVDPAADLQDLHLHRHFLHFEEPYPKISDRTLYRTLSPIFWWLMATKVTEQIAFGSLRCSSKDWCKVFGAVTQQTLFPQVSCPPSCPFWHSQISTPTKNMHVCAVVCVCVCVHGWLAGWLATWVDAWVWLVIKFQLMLAYFISIIASSKHLSIYSLLVSFLYLLSTGCLVRYFTDMNAQEQVELVRGASREVVSAAEALTPQVWSVEMRRFAK